MNKEHSSSPDSAYIIDGDYHILSYTDSIKKLMPNLQAGDKCYAALYDRTQPCENCILTKAAGEKTILFNDALQCWIESTASQINWPGCGLCSILFFHQLPGYIPETTSRPNPETLDTGTGLYKKSAFFDAVEQFFKEKALQKRYCLVAIDIEHFKLFNEWYGEEAGDQFLLNIGQYLKKIKNEHKGIAGYMGDDDFAILLPANSSLLRQLETDLISYVRQYRGNAGFLPAMGVYMITDTSVTIQTMYDHAILALNSVKGNYLKRFRIYDASMMAQMEKDHKLLVAIQGALKNQEFTFYLQPKCNLASGKIVALESLVRWNHPTQGVINPGSFIPFLEKNGFITVLDIYIWDLVCQRLRAWLETGRPVLPVSVNVSRIDIYSIDVPEHFKGLIEKYKLPPNLLVIEITESAYAEDYELITKVGDQLRSYGFPISMDDFGSGYSSLNMLKDMHFDELKIDMKFLPMNAGTKKETGILESIVSMARLMDLTIIAEGIETKEQLDLLQSMGCRYGQGYYFYRPMPYEEFETLRQDETRFDFRGTKVLHIEHFSIKDLMNQNLFSESVLNNILGGIAFYDVFNDNVELLRANEQYCMITEISPFDLEEQRKSIMESVYPKDRDIVWDIFHRAQHNSLLGAEGSIRRLKADGSVIWIHLRIFFLKEQDGHFITMAPSMPLLPGKSVKRTVHSISVFGEVKVF